MFRRASPRLAIVGKRKITLDRQAISYTIKRSERAKHVRLEIRQETGLTAVIPKSYDMGRLPDLLKSKRGWILGKLAKYGQLQPHSGEKELKSGDTVPYLGRDLQVVKRLNSRNADSRIVALKTSRSVR